MIKFSNFYKPTPVKLRKLGDAILASAGIISAGGLVGYDQLKEIYTASQIREWITAIIIMGIVGKFLTNFFKDASATTDVNPGQPSKKNNDAR